VIAGVMTPTHRGGVVAPLIDPILLEPHRLMPRPSGPAHVIALCGGRRDGAQIGHPALSCVAPFGLSRRQ
jgi:hypothetical protein